MFYCTVRVGRALSTPREEFVDSQLDFLSPLTTPNRECIHYGTMFYVSVQP